VTILSRLPLLWGLFSGVYVLAVVHRAVVFGIGPGLPTLAAAIAITAVWLDIAQLTRGSIYLRVAVVAAVFMTLVTNVVLALTAIVGGRGLSVGRLALSAFFALILGERISDIVTAQRHSH
jgi:hypothetical protein